MLLGVFRKNIFFCYEDFVDIFGGSSKNWTIFRGSFLCVVGSFLRSRYNRSIWNIVGVAKISNIF